MTLDLGFFIFRQKMKFSFLSWSIFKKNDYSSIFIIRRFVPLNTIEFLSPILDPLVLKDGTYLEQK